VKSPIVLIIIIIIIIIIMQMVKEHLQCFDALG